MIWKPIGRLWEVSSAGLVRNVRTGKLLSPHLTEKGYAVVALGRGRTERVHRLVLVAFDGPCPQAHEAHHLNGVRSDNRLENLAWVTHAQNIQHAYAAGSFRARDLRRASRRCPNGHERAPYTRCRICVRAATRRYRLRKKEAA